MSLDSYLECFLVNVLLFAVISGLYSFTSPENVLNVTLFHHFHLCNQSFDALRLLVLRAFAKSFVFAWGTRRLISMLFDVATINPLGYSLLVAIVFPILIFFLFKYVKQDEKSIIIFSLICDRSHVEVVFCDTRFFSWGFVWRLWISCNALNFSPNFILFFYFDVDLFTSE